MSMIRVENLTFSYPSSYDNIFENVNFQIDTDWKLGFVGRNGRGKTTFLSLLLGKYEYRGKISASVEFDYFPYPVKDTDRLTEDVLREVCPLAEEWEVLRELSWLEVDADVLWRPFGTLSNGERSKALLAALFLNEGHFLLIDEPTNHLDSKGREIVSAYLRRKNGFILVSHDRSFLDGCVDHILSLNRADIQVQKGDFSSWYANFEVFRPGLYRQMESEEGRARVKEALPEVLDEMKGYETAGLNWHYSLVEQVLDLAEEKGIGISVWTVDEEELQRKFLRKHVDNITTRRLKQLITIRNEERL